MITVRVVGPFNFTVNFPFRSLTAILWLLKLPWPVLTVSGPSALLLIKFRGLGRLKSDTAGLLSFLLCRRVPVLTSVIRLVLVLTWLLFLGILLSGNCIKPQGDRAVYFWFRFPAMTENGRRAVVVMVAHSVTIQ